MANSINWGKIYESTYWGSGVADNTINWGKSYRDLAGDPAPFITEWRTETNGETITIPIITTNTCTYTTSDGQSGTIIVGGSTTITFPTAGTHEVSISGDIQQISFSITNTSKDYIYDVKQWGTDTTWTSFESAFLNCSNLNVTASDAPIIGATSMRTAFTNCINLIGTPAFNNWDVSNVTVMAGMFRNTSFNQGIGNWNVSSVASMGSMFRASNFNQDIGNWDVSSVTNMGSMFYESPFNQDISSWDISNVNNFLNFLYGGELSISNYDALLIGWAAQSVQSNITIDFGNSQYTAGGAAELARISLQDNYNWAITDGGIGAFADNVFVTEWQTATAGETLTIPMVTSNTYDVVVISDDNTHEQILLNQTGSTTTASIPDAGTYQVGVIGNAQQIKFNNGGDKLKIYDVKQWGTDTTWTSFSGAFYGCSELNITASDAPNLSSVTSMTNAFRASNLTTFNNVNNWDVSSVTNMRAMFDATPFNQDIGNWDVSSVTDMSFMFRSSTFNQDIGSWNVSNVTTMRTMFNSLSFNQDISNWDIINVTDFTNFLSGGTLSTSNYDALLNGWYSTLKAIYVDPASPPSYPGNGLSINFGNSVSSSAGSASKLALTQSPFNWTITDGTP